MTRRSDRIQKTKQTVVSTTHTIQQEVCVSGFTATIMLNQDQSGSIVEFGLAKFIYYQPKGPAN